MSATAGVYQVRPVEGLSEKAWQGMVLKAAALFGWLSFHPYLSVRSAPGWPDLALCRPPRLILAELKTDRGRLTREQRHWLEALSRCPGVECYCWRPRDVDRVVALLQGHDAGARERGRSDLLGELG